jgi:hypothetical protein
VSIWDWLSSGKQRREERRQERERLIIDWEIEKAEREWRKQNGGASKPIENVIAETKKELERSGLELEPSDVSRQEAYKVTIIVLVFVIILGLAYAFRQK